MTRSAVTFFPDATAADALGMAQPDLWATNVLMPRTLACHRSYEKAYSRFVPDFNR